MGRRAAGRLGQALQVARQHAGAAEVLGQAPAPGRRQAKGVHQRHEDADVAEGEGERAVGVETGALEAERHDLRLGRLAIGAAEKLDAGLVELAVHAGRWRKTGPR